MNWLDQLTPLNSTALLGRVGREPSPQFLGTAFAYRSGQHFLTAAHCVGSLSRSELALSLSGGARTEPVVGVERHPTADEAVLTLGHDVAQVEPFIDPGSGRPPEIGLGHAFYAFGYPEDFLDYFGDRRPTPRVFAGHVQRLFEYRSYSGFAYTAAELSIPAPVGLSGGPVFFATSSPRLVFGVVAENVETTTQLHEEEIVTPATGEKRTVQTRRVISYGVAVHLPALFDWLNAHLPPSQSAWVRYQQQAQAQREADEL